MLVYLGFGTYVDVEKVVAVARGSQRDGTKSLPIARWLKHWDGKGKVVDMTYRRRTLSLVLMDNDTVILSAIAPATLSRRVNLAKRQIFGGRPEGHTEKLNLLEGGENDVSEIDRMADTDSDVEEGNRRGI